MTTNGIYVSPTEFVNFGESRKGLSAHIATRDRSPDFTALGKLLPNPDPILKRMGKDVSTYRDMKSRPVIGGAIRRRKAALTSREWRLNKGKSSARTVKFIQSCLDDLDIPSTINDVTESSLFGYQPIEIMWAKSERVVPRELIAKPPEWFTFSTEGELRFRSREALFDGEELPPRKFLLPRQNASYANPWGEADLAMCFWADKFMAGGLRFWVQFTEKYGTPWLVGKVPRNTGQGQKNELLDDLESMIQDAIAVVPDDSSIDIIETGSKSGAAQAFESLLMYCRSEINIALLGQNQSSEASSNRASSTSGLEVETGMIDGLARIIESSFNELIRWTLIANKITDHAPTFELYEQKEIDEVVAKRDKTLTDAGVRFTPQYWQKTYDLDDGDIEITPANNDSKTAAFSEAVIAQQTPQDALVDTLAKGAADPLKTWIEQIRSLVENATSKEQLRDLLLNAYGDLDSTEMAGIMQLAFALADSQGRADVISEIDNG